MFSPQSKIFVILRPPTVGFHSRKEMCEAWAIVEHARCSSSNRMSLPFRVPSWCSGAHLDHHLLSNLWLSLESLNEKQAQIQEQPQTIGEWTANGKCPHSPTLPMESTIWPMAKHTHLMVSWEARTIGSDGWKPFAPATQKHSSLTVHKWWPEEMRLIQVVPGRNRYLHTPIGNFPLEKGAQQEVDKLSTSETSATFATSKNKLLTGICMQECQHT